MTTTHRPTPGQARRVVNLRDVAEHAGVSTMTVSNVVNGKQNVAPATRLKVENSIRTLGYRPNLSARNLARGRTGIITLAIPEVSIPYFAEIAGALVLAASRTHQNVVIEQTFWDRDRELEILSDRHPSTADALVLYPSTLGPADLESIGTRLPVVLFGGSEPFGHVDHIVIDNMAAAREATEHLIARGRRRIALVGPLVEPASSKPNSRVVGYRGALDDASIPYDDELVADAPAYHRQDGQAAMERLLDLPEPPDAVFCLSDLLAIGALKALRGRGLRVPEDVAVMGFDDIEEADFTTPPLTSVRPDRLGIARSAIELVDEALASGRERERDGEPFYEEPRTVLAGHQLVVRESTGRSRPGPSGRAARPGRAGRPGRSSRGGPR